MLKKTLLSILLGVLFLPSFVLAYTSPGIPTGFVNDFANVINEDVKIDLESELQAFQEQTTHEIAVVTIKSLDRDTIENYANLLFREWGIGTIENDNGILFIVSIEDRKMRIESGYKLEGALTDIESKHILDDIVKPYFKDENYSDGIYQGTQEIKKAIQGEVFTENDYSYLDSNYEYAEESIWESIGEWFTDAFEWIIGFIGLGYFLFWFIAIMSLPISWLASIFGRSKSWWAGSIVGFIIGLVIYSLSQSITIIPILAVIGLVFDYFVSKNYKANKKSWWAGGRKSFWDDWGNGSSGGGGFSSGGGSSSSSGGGFSGFSGGSSGGGGASSGW